MDTLGTSSVVLYSDVPFTKRVMLFCCCRFIFKCNLHEKKACFKEGMDVKTHVYIIMVYILYLLPPGGGEGERRKVWLHACMISYAQR